MKVSPNGDPIREDVLRTWYGRGVTTAFKLRYSGHAKIREVEEKVEMIPVMYFWNSIPFYLQRLRA